VESTDRQLFALPVGLFAPGGASFVASSSAMAGPINGGGATGEPVNETGPFANVAMDAGAPPSEPMGIDHD